MDHNLLTYISCLLEEIRVHMNVYVHVLHWNCRGALVPNFSLKYWLTELDVSFGEVMLLLALIIYSGILVQVVQFVAEFIWDQDWTLPTLIMFFGHLPRTL